MPPPPVLVSPSNGAASSPWTVMSPGPVKLIAKNSSLAPAGPSVTGNAHYDFTAAGGYIQGALPIGTYFHFGDLDSGSGPGETFRLTAFDPSGNPITTPWLEIPFAATATAVASDMPNYNFAGGIYD